MVKVVDNLLSAFDNKFATVLLLLDHSASFDIVDQNKLLHILHYENGVNDIPYRWLESFLKGRRVKINNAYSESEPLDFGVAQGSAWAPNYLTFTCVLFNHMFTHI